MPLLFPSYIWRASKALNPKRAIKRQYLKIQCNLPAHKGIIKILNGIQTLKVAMLTLL